MKNRFYLNSEDSFFGNSNYLVFNDGKKIEYSFWCSDDDDFPPQDCGYRLVYKCGDDEDFRIVYGLNRIDELDKMCGSRFIDECFPESEE